MKFSIIYFWLIIFKAHFYLGFQFNSALFEIKNYQVIDYSWLIASIEFKGVDIFKCLQECNLNYYCSYVEHNSTNCNMFSEYVSNFLVSLNSKIIYKKVDFSMKFSTCSKSNEFWSLNLNKCLPCPFAFARRADLPYTCFRTVTNTNDYASGKSNCKLYGATLPRPKTALERSIMTKWIVSQGFWIDSSISKLNEVYKWGD